MITLSSDVLELQFKKLVREWKQERNRYSSRPDEWAMCWPYQKIMAMGAANSCGNAHGPGSLVLGAQRANGRRPGAAIQTWTIR
jgi:hypothetical protein